MKINEFFFIELLQKRLIEINKHRKRCTHCIMDDTAVGIKFDKDGRCNYCKEFELKLKNYVEQKRIGKYNIDTLISKIKRQGKHKKYDCIMG